MQDAGFQPAGPSSRGRRCLQHAWPGAALALHGAPSILSSPRGRVVLGGRPTCGAARREAPSQLFGTSDPDGMFHVPHTLRIRRTIGISDEFGRSAVVPRVGVCASDRSMGPFSSKARWPWPARLPGVQERSGSDVSHTQYTTDAAGVHGQISSPISPGRYLAMGMGSLPMAAIDLGDAKQPTLPSPNGRPPSSERQALEDGGTTCSPDLSLSAACRAKGAKGAKGQAPLQDLIPDFWRRGPMGGRPAPPCLAHVFLALRSQQRQHQPLVRPWSNVRATRPPHQVPDALPSLPDGRKAARQ